MVSSSTTELVYVSSAFEGCRDRPRHLVTLAEILRFPIGRSENFEIVDHAMQLRLVRRSLWVVILS